ncbi:MAG: pirin family protein [Myxococcaceae bacterium]
MLRLSAKASPVGDFTVQRALPLRERRFVGPFCFLDHMGPHTSVGSATGGVGPHPHIGLSTVTFLFDGQGLHRDSLGTEQLITPGDVNWMTAGRGIVHSERTPASLIGKSSTMHGLQIWVGLPTANEEDAPSFQHVGKKDLPRLDTDGLSGTLVLGSWGALRSPVRISSPLSYAVLELDAGADFLLPPEHPERAVYVVEGQVTVGDEPAGPHEIVHLDPGEERWLTALTPARVAILAGQPLDGPRYLLWNFVSSRKARLDQAREDWIARRFPTIPGDADERIPYPGEKAS